jgi:uncharacterized protein YjbI with pentapeptide repeats
MHVNWGPRQNLTRQNLTGHNLAGQNLTGHNLTRVLLVVIYEDNGY